MGTRHEALLQRWFEHVWNRGEFDEVDRILAPRGVIHDTVLPGQPALKAGEFKAVARTIREAIPDIHFHLDECFDCGEHVAARLTVTGTHSGSGLGIVPTGRPIRVTGLAIVRVVDGRFVEGWSSFDMLGFFEQLGAVRRPTIRATG